MQNKHYILFLLLFCRLWMLKAEDVYRERVYLQTDKEVYLTGELLWLKMYVTDEKLRPSDLSKIGYIELMDEESPQVQIKLDIFEGTGDGWMEIPVTLPTGNYRLYGYTWYMQNEGEDVFFNKEISIINPFRADETIPVVSSGELVLPSAPAPVNTLSLSTGKSSYPIRSEVKVMVDHLPANLQSVSISVAGAAIRPPHTPVTLQTWRNRLQLSSASSFTVRHLPEYEGHIIKGSLIDLSTGIENTEGFPTPMLSFAGNDIRLFSGQTKNHSDITFYTSYIRGRHELSTTVLSTAGKTYRADILSPFAAHTPQPTTPFVLKQEWEEELLQRAISLQLLYSYMGDSLSRIESTPSYFRRKPEWKYDLDEYTRFMTMEETIIEFVFPLRFQRINGRRRLNVLQEEFQGFASGNSLVLIDGIMLDNHEQLFNYDPYLIKYIEVYRGVHSFGNQVFNGIASFRTYRTDFPDLLLDPGTQVFDYEGTQGKRLFHQPDYTTPEKRESRLPDYRHTLVWEPQAQTNGQRTIEYSFYTSDLTGPFTITVEGITPEGEVVYATHNFDVK